jgi:hypothetical protein
MMSFDENVKFFDNRIQSKSPRLRLRAIPRPDAKALATVE